MGMLTRFGGSHFTLMLLLISSPLSAERYQVSTDTEGKARVEQIETQQSASVAEEKAADAAPTPDKPVSTGKRLQVRGISDAEGSDAEPQKVDAPVVQQLPINSDVKTSDVSRDKRSPGVFEQRMLESEGKSREELLTELGNKTRNDEKVIMLDGVRYVDGEALLQDESLAEDRARYFTTIDMDGRAHNIYFSPEMEKRARKELREHKLQYTSATEYVQQDEAAANPDPTALSKADPAALAILGAASPFSYFSAFLEHCCQRLPNRVAHDLESGVPLFFDIKSSDSPYRFSEGDSRYVLIRLPEDTKDFTVRLKSFIKEFRKQDINHGVFYPQMTLLSREKKPLRMLRDASFEFAGETWSNYGFLQGVFRVSREKEGAEEHFLLIHTDRSALNKSSYFEMDEEQIQVQHMAIGSVSVEILAGN